MNFRYNIYPSVKTAEETVKALENLRVQFLRFAKFNYSTINLSDLGVDVNVDIREVVLSDAALIPLLAFLVAIQVRFQQILLLHSLNSSKNRELLIGLSTLVISFRL